MTGFADYTSQTTLRYKGIFAPPPRVGPLHCECHPWKQTIEFEGAFEGWFITPTQKNLKYNNTLVVEDDFGSKLK